MNPTMALMLSEGMENDRRRELERRQRLPQREPADRPGRGMSLTDMYRLPRFGLSAAKG